MATPEAHTIANNGPRTRGDAFKVALAFTTIYLVWGSTYLAIRYTVATIPPLLAAGVRCFVAGAILLGWTWVRGFGPKREHWFAGVVLGALFFLASYGLLNWGEQKITSELAALVIATEPLFIVILGWAAGQRRIDRSVVVALVLGTLGVASLVDLTHQRSELVGLAAVLLAALSWSAGVVIQPRLPLPADAVSRTAVPSLCGGVMLLIASALSGELQTVHVSAIDVKSSVGLAYLVVFGSVLALTAYTWLLQRFPPALVATHTYVNPIVAVLLGWLISSEPLNAKVLAASAVILLAIALLRTGAIPIITPRRRRPMAGPAQRHYPLPRLIDR